MIESCKSCCYFLIQPDEPKQGICRRYPPTSHIITEMQMLPGKDGPKPQTANRQQCLYPLLSTEDGWCGEFQPTREHVH